MTILGLLTFILYLILFAGFCAVCWWFIKRILAYFGVPQPIHNWILGFILLIALIIFIQYVTIPYFGGHRVIIK